MTDLHEHPLDGCAPTPLASYLKALGVLRLLAMPANSVTGEAADPAARGWWKGERFHLKTRLSRDALVRFFLEDYAPSPIIAPWNGRAGFLEGDAGAESSRTGARLTKAIEGSKSPRLGNMRAVIAALRKEPMLICLDELRAAAKAAGEEEKRATGASRTKAGEKRKALIKQAEITKSALLPSLRSNADVRHLPFIDACFVLAEDERAAPLLGSGGNDGSRDFGTNFAEALDALFDFEADRPKTPAHGELEASLFAAAQRLETTGAIGQFEPGQGGPNASTRYEGWNPLNRWDVILLLEGTLLFAGALTRRWGVNGAGRAAFPFTFEPSGAGAGALSSEDPTVARGEIWTPLWAKRSSLAEIETLLAEGRLTLGRVTARTGLDAARAVARLGLSRGIASFERYSLIQPDRKMPYQATPLGRFRTPDRPRRDLIADLDAGGWLTRLRRAAGKNAPARARIAVRRLEDALFEIARGEHERDGLQAALVALGGVVSWLATGREAREREGRENVAPPRLSWRWVRAADDDSPEFRVAAALASLGWPPISGARGAADAHETADAAADEEEPPASLADDDQDGDDGGEPADAAAGGGVTGAPAPLRESERKSAPPMAAHFAPVDEATVLRRSPRRSWAANDPPSVVWGSGAVIQNMIAVLERRLIEQAMRGLANKPLAGACPARLSDIAAFLEGPPAFDDARCAALLSGLVWAQPARLPRRPREDGVERPHEAIPFAYAALKPLFTPDDDLRAPQGADPDTRPGLPPNGALPIPPGIVARLRRGGVGDAVRMALARARASGLASPFDPGDRAAKGADFGAAVAPERLAAALLIPIDGPALNALLERAYPNDPRKEYPNNAA